jgi:O-antigen ligase
VQPALGGAMLVAGLGLHLGPALLGTGRARWLGLAGVLVSLAALVANGSRGAWIAAAVLLALTLAMTAFTRRPGESRARGAAVAAAALALILLVALTPLGASARARVADLYHQARAGWAGEVDSDVGGRILAARAALHAFAQRPLEGAGTGAYPLHLKQFVADRGTAIAPERLSRLLTAHNTWLQAAACAGLVGAGLLASAWLLALVQGLRSPGPMAAWLGGYGAGPALALLGLLCASPFETINLNLPTMALFSTLVALCPPVRLPERLGESLIATATRPTPSAGR